MYATAYGSPAYQFNAIAAGAAVSAGHQIHGTGHPEHADPPRRVGVTLVLEPKAESASVARRATRAVLQAWQMGAEAIDGAALVVSELVTNAVEYAQPPLALHLHREPAEGRFFWVSISDGGPAQPAQEERSCAEDEHGRGLMIVNALVDAHGVDTYSGGTIRWARLNAEAGTVRKTV